MRASMKHLQSRSAEGVAILKEKHELLWKMVKKRNVEPMRVGGVHLAAMPQRFMIDTRRRGVKSVRWRRRSGD
jgi:hypothetical protein